MENQTPKPKEPSWEEVDSSMIDAFRYDEAAKMLEVRFHNTGVYRYFDVPAEVVNGLRQATSKESYMRSMIIDAYPTQKGRTG